MPARNEPQPGQADPPNTPPLPPYHPASRARPFEITLWAGKPYRLSASHFYTIGMPILAILCTYFGAAQRTTVDSASEALQQEHYQNRTIDEVSKWWGKGEFLSWLPLCKEAIYSLILYLRASESACDGHLLELLLPLRTGMAIASVSRGLLQDDCPTVLNNTGVTHAM